MFTPIDLSAFYTRKPQVLKRTFSLVAEYLKTEEDSETENLMDYGQVEVDIAVERRDWGSLRNSHRRRLYLPLIGNLHGQALLCHRFLRSS